MFQYFKEESRYTGKYICGRNVALRTQLLQRRARYQDKSKLLKYLSHKGTQFQVSTVMLLKSFFYIPNALFVAYITEYSDANFDL